MPGVFQYDVFLSQFSKDKAVVRSLAERLPVAVRQHLTVGFDEWELPVAASRQSAANSATEQAREEDENGGALPRRRYAEKIEARLERSRVLPLAHRMGEGGRRPGEGCLSAQAFGSDWVRLLPASQPSTNRRPAEPGAPLQHLTL